MAGFEVKVSEDGGVVVVAPAGQLDSRAAPEFEREVLKAVGKSKRELLFDLSALDYVASAGLRVVIMIGKRLQADGGALALCGLNASVRQVFDVAGFSRLFPIYADRTGALAAIKKSARLAGIGHIAGDLLHRASESASSPRVPVFSAADPARVALAAEILGRETKA